MRKLNNPRTQPVSRGAKTKDSPNPHSHNITTYFPSQKIDPFSVWLEPQVLEREPKRFLENLRGCRRRAWKNHPFPEDRLISSDWHFKKDYSRCIFLGSTAPYNVISSLWIITTLKICAIHLPYSHVEFIILVINILCIFLCFTSLYLSQSSTH